MATWLLMALRIAVLGTGLMGAAIAADCASFGHFIRITSSRRVPAEEALARVGMPNVEWRCSAPGAAEGADLVIEALPEELELKQKELAAAQVAAPGAVLGTNTSSLRVASIARALPDPSRLVGMHFVNPPAAFALAELVAPETADADVVGRASAMLKAIGKEPVHVHQDVTGFVFNRLQFALLREAIDLVDAGVVEAADLDRVVTEGVARRWAAVGPLASVDLGGADLFRRIAERIYPELSVRQGPPLSMSRRAIGAEELESLRGKRAEVVARIAEACDAAEAVGR